MHLEELALLAVIAAVLIHIGVFVTRLGWRGYLALQNALLDLELRRLDLARTRENNRLITLAADHMPVSRQLVESGAIIPQQLRLMLEEIISRRLPQNVPHSIRIDHAGSPVGAPTSASTATATPEGRPPIAPPADFWQLWSSGQLPGDKFLMGHSLEDGQPVTATWRQLYSALIGGLPGTGKSTLIRCILAQAALQGGRFLVIDPHFGAGDESLGASLQPLRRLLLTDVAVSPGDTLAAITYIHQIGRKRMSGDDADRTPLILIVDEATALLSRGSVAPELSELLAEIAQEMRKTAIYALCIGQQFRADIMDSVIRNSFVSMITCRTRREVARIQSGSNEFGKLAETLTTGQAVWMTPDGTMARIAVPNTTQHHISAIALHLPPTAVAASKTPTTPGPNPGLALTPQDSLALTLFRQGAQLKEIVTNAYQVTTGAPYTNAVQRFLAVVRSQLP